jgi:nitrogen regulatory protein P-II 1
MGQRELVVMTDASLITCVVQRGKADAIVSAARGAGVQGATIYYGRGTGVRERLGLLGLTVEAEKEIITIIVANDQLDHIFEKIYLAGEIDTPGMGVIYVTKLDKIATYVPDEILHKLEK